MKRKDGERNPSSDLRKRAEDRLRKSPHRTAFSYADADREKLVQEMQIHQIELEMQNEELMKLRDKAEQLAEKYIDVYDFSPTGYLSLDSLGVIAMANLMAAQLFGINRASLIGKRFCGLISGQSLAAFNDFFKEAFRIGSPPACELAIDVDGHPSRTVQVKANLPASRTELRLALIDITNIKRAEGLLLQKQRQLEEVNRELETFSFSVSHDLQTPLRAIRGFSNMIINRDSELFCAETRRQFEIITENVKQMEKLIDDLLAFSRLEKSYMSVRRIDVPALVREVWQVIALVNPDHMPTLKLGKVPPCFADRALLKQALGNILGNAVKYSRSSKKGVVEVGATRQKDETVYYIRDNGIGFDMADYNKLFAVFKTLHSREKFTGSGVGLALAQRIITRHGGRIWAESEVGKGATFYFTLPAQHDQEKNEPKNP